MEQQTTSVVPLVSAERAKTDAAAALYKQHCALPAALRGTQPTGMSKVGTFVYDWLLPKLGMKWVVFNPVEHDGRAYYTFKLSVFFRTVQWAVTPVSAYFIAQGLVSLHRMGITNHLMLKDDEAGVVYIPSWAHYPVAKACSEIVNLHESEVKMVVNEIHRLVELRVSGAAALEDGVEPPAEQRILH